jgi:F-type H+-transporting ATPase subunit delta
MPRAASPRRYAQAVFQIATESGQLDGWSDDLRTVATALENKELAGILDSPQVPAAAKIETVKTVLGDAVDPLATNLLALLATRNLANLIPGIIETFEALVDHHNGIERAEVISAAPLDHDQEAAIKAVLVKLVNKDVRLSTGVDPNILGGLVARVGDRVIDGSLRTRLQGMRRTVVEQIT